MTQKERLILLLKDKRLGQSKFEEEIGASRGSISHMGDFVSPNFRAKIKEKFPEVNLQWLIAGVGTMYAPDEKEEQIPKERAILLEELAAQRELMEKLTSQMNRINDNIDECQNAINKLLEKL